MSRREIRVTGYGGQGVIMTGYIFGKAASIFDGIHSTLTQSFGPEARGGACSAQVIVSESEILYPYLTVPEILVTMSQEAYNRFEPTLAEDGILLIEQDLVMPHVPRDKIRMYSIPATRIAEMMGNRMFANMVMLGFLAAVTGITSKDALREALPGFVPDRSLEKNLQALEKGYEEGLKQVSEAA